jgi:hypothetical protein
MRWRFLSVVLTLAGCGSDSTEPVVCGEDERLINGVCEGESGCTEPSVESFDGSCASVGVPSGGCAEGFVWNAGTCTPSLPSGPCAPGTMAIVGETVCRPVMPCPSEPWGGIDGGASPQWVDAAYRGADSDGTEARPWTTIGDAVAAAADGATIGIAAGSYMENVAIAGRALHLHGSCPERVVVAGVASSNGTPAVLITGAAATGASLIGLSVTSPTVSVGVSGATDVLLDRVWLHDAGALGLDVEDPLGPTSVTLVDSLIESVVGRGALALGSGLVIERSVIRSVDDDGLGPAGVHATTSNYTSMPASLSVSRSVFGTNAGIGIFVVGSAASVDGSVVHDTRSSSVGAGFGIALQADLDLAVSADVSLVDSALLGNTLAGVNIIGSVVRLERVTIADTLASTDPVTGQTLDGGRGINVQDDDIGNRGILEVVDSAVVGSWGLGVFIAGGDASLHGTWIRDSKAAAAEGGRGVNLQPSAIDAQPSTATIQSSLVANNQQFGIFVGESILTLENSEVRGVSPAGEFGFGDTIAVVGVTSALSVVTSRMANSMRAGLSLFSANANLVDSRLSCHPIDIAVQDVGAGPSSLFDGGGNSCGCGEDYVPCKATASELTPPSPL